MRHDLVADVLSAMTNAVKARKKECVVRPVSNLAINVINLLKREGYIEDFQVIDTVKGREVKIVFNGRMNRCFAIKPRFSAKKDEIEKFEKRYLPAKDFGFLILSTPKGLLTHLEAKDNNVGGVLIAYVY